MAPSIDIRKVALIGCGSMGGGLALLCAENGCSVALQDPSEETMDKVMKAAKQAGMGDKFSKHKDYKSLCAALDTPKVFIWSLPHGSVGDTVLTGLLPYLDKGDIIIDCGNEHWENTERRQGKCVVRGIRYVGCGVSGGYQAARHGPSMCPGADDETLDLVLPFLRKIAAKDPEGRPCVAKAGSGGSGHYIKMIHNGIEHGMMSAVAEAWSIMVHGLSMTEDAIGDVFEAWNASGELRGTFLVEIGADICRTKDRRTGERVLDTVEDKVVQDISGEEGTGIWSNEESVAHHVPAPTLTSAHYLRLASAYRSHRQRAADVFGPSPAFPPQNLEVKDKPAFLEALRRATYTACLASYVQGVAIIAAADATAKWNVDYAAILQIWKAGCIIRADYISSDLLAPVFSSPSASKNLLFEPVVARDLKAGHAALKQVVGAAVAGDHVVPALAASLEWVKYSVSTELPTQFYEAELDYFGKHMYDRKGEDGEGLPVTGRFHYEWNPA